MAATSSVTIEVRGARAISRALRLLGETDAPFLRQALSEGGDQLAGAARSRATGSIGGSIVMQGVRGSGGALRARIVATHPGAKAMEFGRKTYYRGFTNRRQKATGTAFQASPGQRARPFVGIRTGGQAVGATKQIIGEKILSAFDREWDRVAGGPD